MTDKPAGFASWRDVEQHYRNQAQAWETRANDLNALADGCKAEEDFNKKVKYLRASTKCAVQARDYSALADNAKSLFWQDEASQRLAELEAEEADSTS